MKVTELCKNYRGFDGLEIGEVFSVPGVSKCYYMKIPEILSKDFGLVNAVDLESGTLRKMDDKFSVRVFDAELTVKET